MAKPTTRGVDKIQELGGWKGTAKQLAELLDVSTKTARRYIDRAEQAQVVHVDRLPDGFRLRPVRGAKVPQASKPSSGGRPAGSAAAAADPPPQVEAHPTRCPRCGSTERTAYRPVIERAIQGENRDGPYTHVVWRDTNCEACGHRRRDVAYENRT